MADPQQQDEDLIISFFPDPPPFYKHFTSENVQRLQKVKEDATSSDQESPKIDLSIALDLSAEQILGLPTELRYLIPPEPPADNEEFHVFNEKAKAKGSDTFMEKMEHIGLMLKAETVFDEWTYEQLYPSPTGVETTAELSEDSKPASTTIDRQNYLFRFTRSILLSYIALLGIVASDATSPQKQEKLKDMLTMVTNMHALINEYRPHQARETLIKKMEEQVERKKREIEGVRKMSEKVRSVLDGFGRDMEGLQREDKIIEPDERVMVPSAGDVRLAAQRYMWDTLDEILGQ